MPPESDPQDAGGLFTRKAAFQLPTEERRALLLPGSLSSRLQRWCGGKLAVTVVSQGPTRPTRDEARLLGLKPREQVWAREVRLGPPQQPWVRARTVAPLREMQGVMQHLRNLGDRPLGSVLFNGRGWQRSPFWIGTMKPATGTEPLPARRSRFSRGRNRLLVTEGFYPAYWSRLKQERRYQNQLDFRFQAASEPMPGPP